MRPRSPLLLLSLAALAAMPAAAQVPDSPAALSGALRGVPGHPITLNRTVESRLEDTDPRLPDGHRFHVWEYTGRAGERVVIDHSSGAFDAFVMLVQRGSGNPRMVDANDDGPDNTDAQLAVELPENGTYLIVATSLEPGGTGAYRLTVRAMEVACAAGGPCAPRSGGAVAQQGSGNRDAAIAAATPRDLRVGAETAGRLDDRSATMPSGEPFDVWRFTGRAGDTVVVSQRSSAFDARLWLYARTGDAVREIGEDDDGGGNADAELVLALPETGEYLLVAAGYSESSRGDYHVSVQPVTAACAAGGPCAVGESSARNARIRPVLDAPKAPVEIGGRASDTLYSASPSLEGRGRFRAYRFTATAGERIVIELRSADFDAFLVLARMDGDRLRFIAEDDDGGVGTNSRLVAVLPNAGEYVIVAAAFDPEEAGAFTVMLDRCDAECAGRR